MQKYKLQPIIIHILSLLLITISCSATAEFTKEELEDPNILLDKGRDYFFEEEYDAAITCFEVLIQRFPKRIYSAAWAQYEIGMAHYLKKDYEEARGAFIKVLSTYNFPKQARTLSLKLVRKIDREQAHKRSSYSD